MNLPQRKTYERPHAIRLRLPMPRHLLSDFSIQSGEEIPLDIIEDYGEL